MKEVVMKGHAHSFNLHWYKKVNGVWKFAGLCPDIRWGEYDFDRIFEAGREEMGEENGMSSTSDSVTVDTSVGASSELAEPRSPVRKKAKR
jgi:scytalone dehydratase